MRADDPPVTGLGLLLGIAVQSALSALMPQAEFRLKWPNDVMVGRAKLAGILLEREGEAVIAGIGINVASAPTLPDRATIALAELADSDAPDAAAVLDALVPALDYWLDCWRREGQPAIINAWLARAHPVGTMLRVAGMADQPRHGRFLGLGGDGALILGLEDGTQHIIHSGDVGMLP